MATSPDHPDLYFVQAAGYTKGRPDGPPLWIVIHTMEASETSTRAENTAAYFANPSDGRSVSAHYCVDSDSVIQCVRLADSAWTVGNRPGNNRGINWELSGFARQTRAEWLDAFSQAQFRQMAPYVRADAARFSIPLRRCSIDDLRAFRPGITTHNDLRLAFGVTTHTDPGPNFPWDVFLSFVTEEDDMTPEQSAWLQNIYRAVFTGGPSCGLRVAPDNGRPPGNSLVNKSDALLESTSATAAAIEALRSVVEQLSAAIIAGGGNVDTAGILAGVDQRLQALEGRIRVVVDEELDEQARAGADED